MSAAPASAEDRAYTKRFGVNELGDVRIVGNTSMSCVSGTVGCTAARAGTGSSSNWNNDAWLMGYVDADSDLTTYSSSMATLDMPAGATVLFAGLYWGGDAPTAALRNEVKFDTPAIGGYQDLTATTFDTSTTTPTAYQGFYDVTSLVAAGGAGDYWVANVQGTPGETNKHAGWGLVVAYRDSASPRQNIAVFDGFQDVKAGDSHAATLTGLTTPASGTVDATLGLLAYEGDLGITGDVLAVDSTTLSNALNPANNSFNSSITHRGMRLTAKQPDYVNQFSVEMDTFDADAIVPANATSATFTMTSTQDRYYPGVITYAGEAETVPPVTTFDSGPSGFTNDPTPTYAFSSNEAGSTFECRLDGGAWASCSSGHTITTLTDGSHTFEVRATDVAGNVEPIPASLTFTVDTVLPQTTINSGPSGPTGDATPTFAFSSSQSGSSFECRVDGGAWGSCSSPETTASLSDGVHTFEVRAIDPAGNIDPSPASSSFTVDTAVPDTTIDSGPSGPTNDPTPTFDFSADQPGTTFECRVDGGAWASCSTPETTPSLADGAHTFEVRATDTAGNVDPTPASRTFTVETGPAETAIDSGPSGPTNDPTPTFDFSADEAGSTFECRVDGGTWASCSSPETTASLADGAHTFEVRAIDSAGNVDPTPESLTFTVDTAVPQTTIGSGPSGPTNDPTPTFDFSADQPGTTFECRVDGGAWASCSSGYTTATLTDGSHTLEVRAIDPAGNVDPTPESLTFTVDTALPQTTIDSAPSGPTDDPTPTFDFSADQPGTTFECRVDGGTWASCSSPETTASLADGAHTFEVRATDPAGNTDATPAQHAFVVETGPPETTIDSGPSGPTNDATPTFDFSADEPGTTFECRVDGGAWASCSSGHTTTTLTDGAHTLEVRAIDSGGNVDPTPGSSSFAVDTALPQTTIGSAPSGPTNDPTPTFDFAADEPGTTFECRVDGGAWASCSSGYTTATLTDGAHTLEVRAIDPAGNVDPTPESLTFTVDTATPSTTPPPDGGQPGTSNDQPPRSFTPSDDQTATQSGLSSLPGSLVGERSCQRLGAGLRTKRMKVRGIGRVRVRIRAGAVVMAHDPIKVRVAGPRAGKRRLRSVGYVLDGHRMRGARRRPFTLAIAPANLARVGRHTLALKLKPKRGRRRTVKLGMRTFPCTTVFRAYQKRVRGGARLKLRIDARDAVAGAIFTVPHKMLPRRKARVKVGKLRVVSANSASRSWKLAFGAKPAARILAGRAGAPAVTVRGTKVRVSRLPAGTGIVEVFLNTNKSTRPAAFVRKGRSIRLRARVMGASSQRLTYKLRGRR